MLDFTVYLAIWVVLGGLGGRWVVMPDCKVNLACVNAIWVVLGGPGGR